MSEPSQLEIERAAARDAAGLHNYDRPTAAQMSISADDWRLLRLAPLWVYGAVAEADGSIDEEETAALGEIVAELAGAETSSALTRDVMVSITRDFGTVFQDWKQDGRRCAEGLPEVVALLERGASPEDALAFKTALRVVGRKVAEARGGIGTEESAALAAITETLDGTRPSTLAEGAVAAEPATVAAPQTKTCPRCGEDIKARAQVCRFCGTELETVRSGYCPACHEVVPVDEEGRCERCRGETIDPHLEARAVATPSAAQKTAAPAPAFGVYQFAPGLGDLSIAPPEARKWNWGAFLLTLIWGMANRVYISLLVLIPVFGLVVPFVLGAKGSEWAWANRRWESVEHFQRTQRQWAIAGAVVWAVVITVSTVSLTKG